MGVLSCAKDQPQVAEQKPVNVELSAVYEPLSVVDYDEIRGIWVENEELRSLKNLAQGWENVPAVGLNNSPLRWGIVNYGSSALTKFARDEAFGQGFKLDETKQTTPQMSINKSSLMILILIILSRVFEEERKLLAPLGEALPLNIKSGSIETFL